MAPIDDDAGLEAILTTARTIAVVGHSDNPERPSYSVAAYLRGAGYTVYPVNPLLTEIDGRPCYPDLASVPEPIDIVDVFRRSEYVPDVVSQAIAAGARSLWLQLGVSHPAAEAAAEAAGLKVVVDRCIAVEHRRLAR